MTESLYPSSTHLEPYLEHRSLFLLGPRQTGKSTLLKQRFPTALASETFRAYSIRPQRLRETTAGQGLVIIDEVQKLPSLLDEAQKLIDVGGSRLILAGSSARKLRRGKANLLGGRALFFNLLPLTTGETGSGRIPDLLQRGGLPGIADSPIAWEALKAYVGSYLREEIQAEGLTRSIENISRFLDTAAHFNAEQIDYTKIGNDAEVSPRTIRDYVQILQDTLILHTLPPFSVAGRRKPSSREKVYFFDVGVANALAGGSRLQPGTPEFGKALEQLAFLELTAAINYQRLDAKLSFWQTRSGIEVDFLVDDRLAIKVKGSGRVAPGNLKSLRTLHQEMPLPRRLIVRRDQECRRSENGIEIMPVAEFCRQLWHGELF